MTGRRYKGNFPGEVDVLYLNWVVGCTGIYICQTLLLRSVHLSVNYTWKSAGEWLLLQALRMLDGGAQATAHGGPSCSVKDEELWPGPRAGADEWGGRVDEKDAKEGGRALGRRKRWVCDSDSFLCTCHGLALSLFPLHPVSLLPGSFLCPVLPVPCPDWRPH